MLQATSHVITSPGLDKTHTHCTFFPLHESPIGFGPFAHDHRRQFGPLCKGLTFPNGLAFPSHKTCASAALNCYRVCGPIAMISYRLQPPSHSIPLEFCIHLPQRSTLFAIPSHMPRAPSQSCLRRMCISLPQGFTPFRIQAPKKMCVSLP